MENFSIKKDGKEYWISRSVAVVGFVFKIKDNHLYMLIEQRGPGAADNIHKWCCPCGYLSYDETLEQAVKRETYEETGFVMRDLETLEFVSINSKPTENHQNVSVTYAYLAGDKEDFDRNRAQGGEENEIENVEWFDIGTISRNDIFDKEILYVNAYAMIEKEWAFNHNKKVIEYLSTRYQLDYGKEEKD